MNWLLNNSAGKPDGMFTFAAISFFVTTFLVLLSSIKHFSIGSISVEISEINVSLITLYFGGAFTSYVVRRNSKLKAEVQQTSSSS